MIVDDQQSAIDHIVEIARPFRNLMLKQAFAEPELALAFLEKNHVDFVVLDMEMPGIDGRAFMLQMPKEIKVILYTAHNQYATDGFDFDVVDFLKKPVSAERFYRALERMRLRLGLVVKDSASIEGEYYYFMMKGPGKSVRTKVNLNELAYIESINNKTQFYLVGDREPDGHWPPKVFSEKLYELMALLKGTEFIQIQRSFILNKAYFGSINGREVRLKGFDTLLPVGKRDKYPEFFAWIERHNLP